MRRADRAIPDSEAREILRRGEYGILSTVSPGGQPYGVPLSYACLGEAIYFHCAVEGHKLDNLAANAKVSFTVVGRTEILPEKFATRYESVVVFGTGAEVTGEEKKKGLVGLIEKYSADFVEPGLRYIERSAHESRVFRISIGSISGKARR
jgi:uncharacterized protein